LHLETPVIYEKDIGPLLSGAGKGRKRRAVKKVKSVKGRRPIFKNGL